MDGSNLAPIRIRTLLGPLGMAVTMGRMERGGQARRGREIRFRFKVADFNLGMSESARARQGCLRLVLRIPQGEARQERAS